MKSTRLHFDRFEGSRFRSGISLHSHTLYSRETLAFVYVLARHIPLLRAAILDGEARYLRLHNRPLNLSRAFWTPPVAPADAVTIEARQIAGLGLRALISITDHDCIDASLSMQVMHDFREIPISVEWTVPYRETFFHLGIHNLKPATARLRMTELADYTARPGSVELGALLEQLDADPACLIIFNHPLWDEGRIGLERHRALALEFTKKYSRWLHALELNGMRPWTENRAVHQMACSTGKVLISGGDRHALEPNTMLNGTLASTFDEFVDEVRSGYSDVLVTSQYREPFSLRMLQNVQDVLGTHENHGRGWKRWDERVFYECEDGETRSLAELWGARPVWAVRVFVAALGALRHPHLKQAFRMAFARGQEARP